MSMLVGSSDMHNAAECVVSLILPTNYILHITHVCVISWGHYFAGVNGLITAMKNSEKHQTWCQADRLRHIYRLLHEYAVTKRDIYLQDSADSQVSQGQLVLRNVWLLLEFSQFFAVAVLHARISTTLKYRQITQRSSRLRSCNSARCRCDQYYCQLARSHCTSAYRGVSSAPLIGLILRDGPFQIYLN